MNKLFVGMFVAVLAVMVVVVPAMAVSTVIVTPSNTQGWSTSDTRTGGAVTFVADATSPYPTGALQLTTDATTTSKAQYMHTADTALSNVTELSYHTKQNSGPEYAAASYQLAVDLNGGAEGGFTTFVYEPYENGTVLPTVWQEWDVDVGQMWSSRSFTDGLCSVTAGGGGAPYYTLAEIQTNCPAAVVVGYGVNIGSNNPSYNVETDGVNFNGTTYNFELVAPTPTMQPTPTPVGPPTDKDQCKNDGWKRFNNPTFKNQGQCVSYTNHN